MAQIYTESLPIPTQIPGKADIIGFGLDGVHLGQNGTNTQCNKVLKAFGRDSGGWFTDQHVRLLADTTGNKRLDIVGFSHEGVHVAENMGNGAFAAPELVIPRFGYDDGWRVDRHVRYVADIRNIGLADIVGFWDSEVVVTKNTDNSAWRYPATYVAVKDFGWTQGWRPRRNLRMLADTTGDGLLDIVGFGETDVYVGRNKGDAEFEVGLPTGVLNFCYQAGWRVEDHPRFLADLTGDKTVDIIGFKGAGVFVSLNDGEGNFSPPIVGLNEFGCDDGWKGDRHPRFVIPLTNEGTADIIGFGNSGVYVAKGNGDGTFEPAQRVVNDFGFDHGWRVDKHPRLVADITGNGCPDIVGFGEDALWASYNRGDGTFSEKTKLTDEFSYSKGWSNEDTIRYVIPLV